MVQEGIQSGDKPRQNSPEEALKLSEINKKDLIEMLQGASTLKEAKEIYETLGKDIITQEEFNKVMRSWQKERQDAVASFKNIGGAAKGQIKNEKSAQIEMAEKTPLTPAETEKIEIPEDASGKKPLPPNKESAQATAGPIPQQESAPSSAEAAEGKTFIRERGVSSSFVESQPKVIPSSGKEVAGGKEEMRRARESVFGTELYRLMEEGFNQSAELLRKKQEILKTVLEAPKVDEAFLTAFLSGELKLDTEDVKSFMEASDKKAYVERLLELSRAGADRLQDSIWNEKDPVAAFRYEVANRLLLLSREEADNILKEVEKKRAGLVLRRIKEAAVREAAEEMALEEEKRKADVKMVRRILGRDRKGKLRREAREEDIRAAILARGEKLSDKELKAKVREELAKYEEERAEAEALLQRLMDNPEKLKSFKESLISAGAFADAKELERRVARIRAEEERKKQYAELLPQVIGVWEGTAHQKGLKQRIKEFLSGEETSFESIRDALIDFSRLLGDFEKVMPGYRPPFIKFYSGERFAKKTAPPLSLASGMKVNIGERLGLRLEPGKALDAAGLEKFLEAVRSSGKKIGRKEREKKIREKMKEQTAFVEEAIGAIMESVPKGDELTLEQRNRVFGIIEELRKLEERIRRGSVVDNTVLRQILKSAARRIKAIFASEEEIQKRVLALEKSGRLISLSELEREGSRYQAKPKKDKKDKEAENKKRTSHETNRS